MNDVTFGERKLVKEISDGNVTVEIHEKEVCRGDSVRLYHDITFYRSFETGGTTHREPYIQQRDFDVLHILIAKASQWVKYRIYRLNKSQREEREEDELE